MASNLISKEQQDLVDLLKQDAQHAFQNVAGNDQFWCRTLVRSVYSYFEAHAFVIRLATLKLLKANQGDFESVAKIALLADTAYQPGRTGKLEDAGEPKTTFINYFAFTLRTYAEAGGMNAGEIDQFFGDNAFNQLQRAKKVRDRLTHPKRLADTVVSVVDVMDLTNAFSWFDQFVGKADALIKQIQPVGGAPSNQ